MASAFTVVIAGADEASLGPLREMASRDAELDLLAESSSPKMVLSAVKAMTPDLLLLDLGLADEKAALSLIEESQALQEGLVVIVLSTIMESRVTMKALAMGALEYVSKDAEKVKSTPVGKQLERAIRNAKTVISEKKGVKRSALMRTKRPFDPTEPKVPARLRSGFDLILIGISTGGPSALEKVLSNVADRDLPPILIVQHMGRLFTTQLAATLTRKAGRPVKEASRNSPLEANSIYVAPGGYQVEIRPPTGGDSFCRLRVVDDPPVNGFCPSVDVTWSSVARSFKGQVAAFLMTGMGEDGAEGMKELRERGAICVAQDKESSTVWGMPGAAVRDNTCHEVLSLDEIGFVFANGLEQGRRK